MSIRSPKGAVELRDLLDSRELHDIHARFVVSETSPVSDLALITDIDEITAVGPDTVILLTPGVALGGWMISSAIRYAWERKACALIVPESSVTETVIDLARRLGVSVLTTNREVTRLALDVAIQIGLARAGSIARIQALTDRVSVAADLDAVVTIISRELGGAPVQIISTGDVPIAQTHVAEGAMRTASAGEGRWVLVTAAVSPGKVAVDRLVAEVSEHARPFAEHVLTAAIPAIRALLSDARLLAMRASLPLVSMTALTGSARLSGLEDPLLLGATHQLRWPLPGRYLALCILTADAERLGSAVHQLWNVELPEVPLARFTDGWLAFVPLHDERSQQTVVARLRERLRHLEVLGLMVGVSSVFNESTDAANSVRKAWLAARLASSADDGADALVEFDEITAHLLGRLLPTDLAELVAESEFPLLLADPGAPELISTLLAFLSTRGSVSLTAIAVGVHRNTVQARIRRAEELGVTLNDPNTLLPVHMIIAALARRRDMPQRPPGA